MRGLLAFTLVTTGCHHTASRSLDVPPNTSLTELFRDTLGANSPAPPEGTRTFNLQEPGQRDSLRAVITRQREQWRAGGARDYDVLLRESCFCPGQRSWLLLEVRDGRVARVRDSGGRPASLTGYRSYSVDGLFEILTQQAGRDDLVAVAFDESRHYPNYVRTDVRLALPDDWGILELRGFRPR